MVFDFLYIFLAFFGNRACGGGGVCDGKGRDAAHGVWVCGVHGMVHGGLVCEVHGMDHGG